MNKRIARGSFLRMHAHDQGRWRFLSGWEVIGSGDCLRCGAPLPLGAHVTRAARDGRSGYACPACVPCHPSALVRHPVRPIPAKTMRYWPERFHAGCRLCEDERDAYEAHLDALGQDRERCPHCDGTGYVPNAAK